jgi:serine/threonine-protein kinase
MTRERWESLAPLVDAVLDQPVERRQAYISEISGGDATLAAELGRFVAAYGDDTKSQRRDGSIFELAGKERAELLSNDARRSSDMDTTLQASLAATYVFEREIGGGGMSRVFVAEERGLGRKVVIKVLPPEMTEGISAERFAREIKLAASLQQANIVPVLAAGTAAGFPYYTMPFVEGRSLRDRLLRDGPLPVSDAISILRDVARALAFAHSRGVVHRDIKPGNILLSDRTAVVIDFGIAKALGAARGLIGAGDTSHMVSRTGTSIGTPAYMAPEQAAGDPNVDHRADIYAFGCVAYELLTGQPPFVRDAPHHVIAAHFQETPRPVTELRPDAPQAVARLVASCLEKDPSRRPQGADDVLLALDAATSQPVQHTPVTRSRRMTVMLSAAAIVVVAALAAWAYYGTRVDEPLTFAVVPFRNLARDTALDYRSDGIGDEILNGIAKVRGVQIVGRSAAFRYKDQTGANAPDVPAIERALGARLLLTGTLRETEGRVTISAQLNDSSSRGEIWSESFTRASSDLASITDDVVRRVADALRAKFGTRVGVLRHASSAGTTNPAALDHYLVGQAQLRRRGSGVAQSIQSFQRAIDLDPNFARAHAALANALALEPFFMGTPPTAVRQLTVSEAGRALSLDSALADGYAALGVTHSFSGEWERSDAEMRRAIELEPDNALIRQAFARHLIVRGYADEALDQLARARKLEPTSPLVSAWLSYALFLKGSTDSALAEIARAVQLDSTPLPVTNIGSLLNVDIGKNDAALRLVAGQSPAEMTYGPFVYAKAGDTATANRLLRQMDARTPRPWFVDVTSASVSLARGDSAAALNALERSASTSGAIWVFFLPLRDPAYDLVRRSPRFAALLRQAGVDLKIATTPVSIARR